MLVFIIGYMASGKTVLGRQLAEMLNCRFLDMDEMIEISTGYSVSDYFTKFGEPSFRKKERELLENHLKEGDAVIAAGGGTPCYKDNMELMNRSGITVYIDTSPEIILSRLAGKIAQRPLLRKVPPDQLSSFIRDHLNARRKFYERARLRINGNMPDLAALVKQLEAL